MMFFVALVLGCFVGLLVARRRPFWMQVVAIGACLGIAFSIVERDPVYLVGTLVLGTAFVLGRRQHPDPETGARS